MVVLLIPGLFDLLKGFRYVIRSWVRQTVHGYEGLQSLKTKRLNEKSVVCSD